MADEHLPEKMSQNSIISRLLQPGDSWQALLIRARYLLWVAAGTMSYFVTNRLNANRTEAIVLAFPFDRDLPFVPSFVYIYMTYHLFIVVTLFLYLRKAESLPGLRRLVTALFVCSIVSAATFLIMPTHVPRPDLSGSSLAIRTLQMVYTSDQPYNCFPSLHVSWTLVAGYYLQKLTGSRWTVALACFVYFILISVSTVAIRQHYTPDAVGGLILGIAAVALAESRFPHWRQA